jgi:sideroflexin-5
VCALAFIFGLPFAISLFPQEGSIAVSRLEPQFAGAVDNSGRPVDTFYFNKGL